MNKIRILIGILFCMVIMGANAKALGNEKYTYITELNENETTTTENSVSTTESNLTIQENPDMWHYTGKYLIPGLKQTLTKQGTEYCLEEDSFIPQGICRTIDYLLISAYDINGICNSVIYVLDATNNSYILTIVLPTTAHVGGIAYDTNRSVIWVCDGKYMSYFSYSVLSSAVNAVVNNTGVVERYGIELISFAGTKETEAVDTPIDDDVHASYCTYYDGLLWVGDFCEDGVSDIYAYTIDSSYNLTPKYIMEAPAKTQGMTFYKSGSTVYLLISASYGRTSKSELIVYKPSYSSPQNISGQNYDRILKNNRIKTLEFSPLTQGVCVYSNKVYVLLESGAVKYTYSYQSNSGIEALDYYLIYDTTIITS